MKLAPVVMSGILALGVVVGQAGAAEAAPAGDYSVTAHRGWITGSSVTENSYRALVRAARHGATAMETDVRMTRDRGFLIMHDATLRRTTDRHGWVCRRRMRYFNRRVRLRDGERVPHLAGMLRRAKRYQLNLVIHLKRDPRWRPRDLRRMVGVIEAARMRPRVTFLSFDGSLLQMVERVDPSLTTDWISTHAPSVDGVLALGVDAVSVRWDQITLELADELRAAGIDVRGRDADDASQWEVFKGDGITEVITDLTLARAEWLA